MFFENFVLFIVEAQKTSTMDCTLKIEYVLLDHTITMFWVAWKLSRLTIRMLSYCECNLGNFCIVIVRA